MEEEVQEKLIQQKEEMNKEFDKRFKSLRKELSSNNERLEMEVWEIEDTSKSVRQSFFNNQALVEECASRLAKFSEAALDFDKQHKSLVEK